MNVKINVRRLTLWLGILLGSVSQAWAHEKWFHETRFIDLVARTGEYISLIK